MPNSTLVGFVDSRPLVFQDTAFRAPPPAHAGPRLPEP